MRRFATGLALVFCSLLLLAGCGSNLTAAKIAGTLILDHWIEGQCSNGKIASTDDCMQLRDDLTNAVYAVADDLAKGAAATEERAAVRKRLTDLLVERANVRRPEADLLVADVCNAIQKALAGHAEAGPGLPKS